MDNSVVADESRPDEIKPKMHFTGTVIKTTLAGAIIDIGLEKHSVLHISQLPAQEEGQPVKRVEDVLKVGDSVEVWVRKVKDERIELTMIKPLDLEWREIKKGMVVKGTVTRLEKFGAFVEIGAERPGLIHISELAHGYVHTPSEVVKEGDAVEAQVLEVNRRKRQIRLSLKALQPEPEKVEEPAQSSERPQQQHDRPQRRRKGSRREEGGDARDLAAVMDEGKSAEPDPTAMEIALREAMEKAKEKSKHQTDRNKKKAISKEQDDILSRTLENKVRTS